MRVGRIAVLVVLTVVVQVVLFPHFRLAGRVPDLGLVLAVAVAFVPRKSTPWLRTSRNPESSTICAASRTSGGMKVLSRGPVTPANSPPSPISKQAR